MSIWSARHLQEKKKKKKNRANHNSHAIFSQRLQSPCAFIGNKLRSSVSTSETEKDRSELIGSRTKVQATYLIQLGTSRQTISRRLDVDKSR